MLIDRETFYGRTIVYDGPYTAYRLAQLQGGRAKHSTLTGNPHFTTFSVVVTPATRHHKERQPCFESE